MIDNMTTFGLPVQTLLALFLWIPFWWIVAGISLYRMRQHDIEKGQTNQTEPRDTPPRED